MNTLIKRTGFSLLELMVVVAIVGVLVSMLIPAVQRAREAASRSECVNNMRQQGIAMHCYQQDYKRLPAALTQNLTPSQSESLNHTAWTLLLPYIDQAALHAQFDFSYPSCNFEFGNAAPLYPLAHGGVNDANSQVVQTYVKTYACPSEGVPEVTNVYKFPQTMSYYGRQSNYLLITFGYPWGFDAVYSPGRSGIFGLNGAAKLSDIKDGLSNTLAVGETRHYRGWIDHTHWGIITNGNVNAYNACMEFGRKNDSPINGKTAPSASYPIPGTVEYGSAHPGGANFLLLDGSVHFLKDSLPVSTLQSLINIRDGGTFVAE